MAAKRNLAGKYKSRSQNFGLPPSKKSYNNYSKDSQNHRAFVRYWKKYRPWTAKRIEQIGTDAQTVGFILRWKGKGYIVQTASGKKYTT